MALARDYKPAAITLDIRLPDIDGWKVLERLKNDLTVRHIPVCVISTDDEGERGLKLGAFNVVTKPIKTKATLDAAFASIRRCLDTQIKQLLVVAPADSERDSIIDLIGGDDVCTTSAATAEDALTRLGEIEFDCVVLQATLPDGTGLDLAEQITKGNGRRRPPVLFHALQLSKKDEAHLRRLTQSGVVKDVQSLDRLFDQTALFLHRSLAKLPAAKREILEKLHSSDAVLAGKRVLVVDDDVRNIFALTSVLEKQNMVVLSAETGKAAIETLQKTAGIDIVLMDIMMPGMTATSAFARFASSTSSAHCPSSRSPPRR